MSARRRLGRWVVGACVAAVVVGCEGSTGVISDLPAGSGGSEGSGGRLSSPPTSGGQIVGSAGVVAPGSGGDEGSGGSLGTGGMGEPPAGVGAEIFAMCKDGVQQPGPRLLRLLTRDEYAQTVADLLYIDAPDTSTLPVEARVRGFDNNARSQAVTSRHVDTYYDLSTDLAKLALERSRGRLITCDSNVPQCAATFVETMGLRAFRRPLQSEEVTRYLALFDASLTGGQFDEGARLVIEAMLISPSFLYRSEVGHLQPDGTFRLDSYEIASALSYLYWGSMPDRELLDAAARDQLQTEQQRVAQARRLLNDERARTRLHQFAMQWLRTDTVLDAFKDNTQFPAFSDGVRRAMVEEQRRFFAKVVLEDEGDFSALYQPGYVLVNSELAGYYGLPAITQDFAPVAPADSQRGGILGLGAVGAAHAHSNESSPIKRGLFVRDRLLCQDLPPPPQNLDTTPPGLDPTLTTRERFARHTADAACSGCHRFIDGVGFGLEGFDGAGRLRLVENGLDVDTSGELIGLESLGDTSRYAFDGPQQLAKLISESEAGKACLTLQYYRFGRGYEERSSDACSLLALKTRFAEGGHRVVDLLTSIVELDSFVVREAL